MGKGTYHIATHRKGRRKEIAPKLTSRNHPHPSSTDGELRHLARLIGACASGRVDLDHDLALVHEEAHLHLAAVLGPLLAAGR